MARRKLLIVGPKGNTHIAGSFERAAVDLGYCVQTEDSNAAYAGPTAIRKAYWRVARRPYHLADFSAHVHQRCTETESGILLTMGQAPLTADAIEAIRSANVYCANVSTDDPWNPAHRAAWHLQSLARYNVVFTPRRSNLQALRGLAGPSVQYLPFGYDPELFPPREGVAAGVAHPEVLFVGGADADRVRFFREFMKCGPRPTFVGGYWDRYADLRPFAAGVKPASEIGDLTARAAVNLCLVRRANRDGHVMRSFEIPASGGFLIAEDTQEHRELFGPDGEHVLYFRSAAEAADKSKWAVAHPMERQRIATAAHQRILAGNNTYKDRLSTILQGIPA